MSRLTKLQALKEKFLPELRTSRVDFSIMFTRTYYVSRVHPMHTNLFYRRMDVSCLEVNRV